MIARHVGLGTLWLGLICVVLGTHSPAWAEDLEAMAVETQPLKANARRVLDALELLGAPLPAETRAALERAVDAKEVQRSLDPHVLLAVSLNPESRVKVRRGPAPAVLQQAGNTPILIKVVNDSTVTRPLRIVSAQSGPVYGGVSPSSLTRQDQIHLKDDDKPAGRSDRFLQASMFHDPPMTPELSGLKVEYALALVSSTEAGRREATIGFDVGQGTQDLGFRGEAPVLFEIRPAIPVRLVVKDHDGTPTTGRFTFLDRTDRVYPPQPKRLAPDFFFQKQIYRRDGDVVLLPPGTLTMVYGRGPEYTIRRRQVTIPDRGEATLTVELERWVNPRDYGFVCGDHHIHAAGCAHYTNPTEGVRAEDMMLQVEGEGLNVGCILTWGPCYDYQRQFFEPTPNRLSRPLTVLKYDVEVSGFGSQALGHVCLLNLKDQTYPGSDGLATKGWPSWTTPVLRWAKAQGAVTGYAHSASGLDVDPVAATGRLVARLDANGDAMLTPTEAAPGLLTESFAGIDADRDGVLTAAELEASHRRAVDQLPNVAIPEMKGVGAQEICVTVAQGLCDFISAMDTPRTAEWNCWYHLLNCGFPLKVSGETDFPCMSSTRVGQGRVYVQLGKIDAVDFGAWCEGIARGRSYVSDGYAHALEFTVDGRGPGSRLELAQGGTVTLKAKVAFAAQTPLGVPYGGVVPPGGRRLIGDTVNLHGPALGPVEETFPAGSTRRVEVMVNGRVAAAHTVPADDGVHELSVALPIDRSSWVALRQFPQLHTNPVDVIVGGRPIRASRRSAFWCVGVIEQLWRARGKTIAPGERDEARATFDRAIEQYQRIAAEAPEGS
jgi:hypothetical protein